MIKLVKDKGVIEIRIHGRGGQGVVTAAELIAISAHYDNKHSQAFPHFGVERSGAPIKAYARISQEIIYTKEQISQPDIILITDHTLLEKDNRAEVLAGSDHDTLIIVNAPKNFKTITALKERKIFATDASEIATEVLGKNIVNTVILGALVRKDEVISFPSLKKAISQKFSEKGKDVIEKNIQAVTRMYKNK